MTPYLSGPMSTIPEFNFPAFFKAEDEMRALGHHPVSPARHDLETYPCMREWPGFPTGNAKLCPEFDLKAALQWDTEQILTVCDSLVMLPGWEQSSGAKLEVLTALTVGLPIYDVVTMQKIEPNFHVSHHSETRITDASTGGQKGQKIERFDLIPVKPLRTVATVYGLGAKKYADRNWEKGYAWSLSYAALLRHITAFWEGETFDRETGLHHMAHATFHCFALIEYAQTHPEKDDRPKQTKS